MIIYNVTVKVDDVIHDEWVQWMKESHIPDVMKTGCFESNYFCKVIKHGEEGTTYAIQYFTPDMKTLHHYQVKYAPALQLEHKARFKDKALAFRTLLEVIS